MRIAQLAPLSESVPPTGYGGTELVVNLIVEELVKRGHEVTLFASGDSRTEARLVSVVETSLRQDTSIPPRRWGAYGIKSLIKFCQMADQFDVVHNHMGWEALPWLDRLPVPSVTTNHNPIKQYCRPIYERYAHLPFVAISQAYKTLNLPDLLNYVDVVYNGIDLAPFAGAGAGDRSYLLFIGRICPDKGADLALETARRLNLPMKLAGKIDPEHQVYFDKQVKPYLSDNKFEYLGEIGLSEKIELYKGAMAVVYPITFDEPFGLVMAESMAAGTPVIALNRGSVQEILLDRQTALVCNSIDEMVKRFPELKAISAQACRERASHLFSKETMVDNYERVYNQALRTSKAQLSASKCNV